MQQKVDIHVEEMKPNSSITGISHIYKYKAPPLNHHNGMYCPNCDGWTWKTTRQCVECSYDIWTHFEIIENKRRIQILKKRSFYFHMIAFGLMLISVITINFFSSTVGVFSFLGCLASLYLGTELDKIVKNIEL